MQLTSAIAIYFLLWIFSAFVVMPFTVRTHDDVGTTPEIGHADSAPVNFQPWRIVGFTTLVATVLFVLFYLNYSYDWIGIEDLDIIPLPDDLANQKMPGE
ncbi:DUF1467 family protein [Croceicoccus mobilis]|uniref:DUF1467 domain-containing protein n=1 Tax=Croceicoccus mobilis TaxID=1703339 RepID=A0A916Z4G9_9SPHN|nr:DUF1467 family protein [Croceicoccus mobilis]GGD76363.1 hypothetical protein GCM10010990_27530 [Croceicoccus mobilis]